MTCCNCSPALSDNKRKQDYGHNRNDGVLEVTPFPSHAAAPFHCLHALSLHDVVHINLTDRDWNSTESKAVLASLSLGSLVVTKDQGVWG